MSIARIQLLKHGHLVDSISDVTTDVSPTTIMSPATKRACASLHGNPRRHSGWECRDGRVPAESPPASSVQSLPRVVSPAMPRRSVKTPTARSSKAWACVSSSPRNAASSISISMAEDYSSLCGSGKQPAGSRTLLGARSCRSRAVSIPRKRWPGRSNPCLTTSRNRRPSTIFGADTGSLDHFNRIIDIRWLMTDGNKLHLERVKRGFDHACNWLWRAATTR